MTVLAGLTTGLDGELRRQILWRVQWLERQLHFLNRREHEVLLYVRSFGWSHERLVILCECNAFYQIVLAPLASTTRSRSEIGLGREIPIKYGTLLTIDRDYSRTIERMMRSFMFRMTRLGIREGVLTANRAEDLIRVLASQMRQSE
jgi:hypothetical protein